MRSHLRMLVIVAFVITFPLWLAHSFYELIPENKIPLSLVKKTPQEINQILRNGTVHLNISYSYIGTNPNTKGPAEFFSESKCYGSIVQLDQFPEPVILGAGHCTKFPEEALAIKNLIVTAFFHYPRDPEELYIYGADFDGDHAIFRFKDVQAAQSLADDAIPLGSSSLLQRQDKVYLASQYTLNNFIITQGQVVDEPQSNLAIYHDKPSLILSLALFNQGGSGGVLLNEYGQMVGTNVYFLQNSLNPFNNPGVGCLYGSIPIDDVKKVLPKYLTQPADKNGIIQIEHPLLKQIAVFNSWELSNRQLASLGVGRPTKLCVLFLFALPESPAATALQPGDIILTCNGHPIERFGQLVEEVFFAFDKKLLLTIDRDNVIQTIEVDLVDGQWLKEQQQKIQEELRKTQEELKQLQQEQKEQIPESTPP